MPTPLYPPELDTLALLPEAALLRVLAEHAGAPNLANLRERLLTDPESLPAGLIEAIERITAMADADGYQMLTEAMGPLFAADGDSPYEVAANVWLDKRDLFLQVHNRRRFRRRGNFQEYTGRQPRRLPLPDDRQIRNLERTLGTRFEKRGATCHCRIHTCRYRDCIVFEVSHGRPLTKRRTVEIANTGRTWADQVSYRPHQVDVVIYDNRTHRLRVCAPNAFTVRTYLQVFGIELFGDFGWFADGDIVSLQPLVELGRTSLEPTRSVRKVELVSLQLSLTSSVTIRSPCVFQSLEEIRIGRRDGTPVRARLRFTYTGGGRPRGMNIGVPNHVGLDRSRDEEVTRAFLEERGFLSTHSQDLRAAG